MVDFAILTIVPEARKAVQDLFALNSQEDRGNQPYVTGRVPALNGGEHSVVLDQAVDRSNLPAQEATQRMLRHWKPRYLVVADIGGGFTGRDGLKVGDVVYANHLHYYELVKETATGDTEPRYLSMQHPTRAPRAALEFIAGQAGWHQTIELPRPGADDREPALLEGEIIAGDRLLSNPQSPTVVRLADTYMKALALDMESAGVARAVYDAQQDETFAQFAVLRGISDLVDDRGTDNQSTRDDWKPYAAHAAAAAALALVRQTRPREQADAQVPNEVLRHRAGFQRSLHGRLPEGSHTFPLELRSAPRGEAPPAPPAPAPEACGRDGLLALLDENPCIVIYGPSGAGKSWTLQYLARQLAAGDDPLVVLVDLKAFRPELMGQIDDSPVGERLLPAIDAILSSAIDPINVARLEDLLQERTVLLLVDGINEVAEVGERMRIALSEYSRHQERVRILVTDRRAEPVYLETRWKLIECRGLVAADASTAIDQRLGPGTFASLDEADRELLELPIFLDWALEIGDPRLAPQTKAVERFMHRSGMSETDLARTAATAFSTYAARRSVFAERELSELGSDDLLLRLHSAGIVVRRGADERFAHQLYHQFSAAYWIAPREELWTPQSLDAITANAASLDAVGMALALISDIERRDGLLRVVYDWNWRAAVMALRETTASGKRVSAALEAAVLAMAAEKQFDPVEGTARRVRRQLRRFPEGGVAALLSESPDHDALLHRLETLEVEEAAWYAEWKRIFLNQPPAGSLSDGDIARVASDEPLLGWTTANTIRRFPFSAIRAAQLRALYLTHRRSKADRFADTIRWRIAHALGRWPSGENAELLRRAVGEDDNLWVRYGAVRSLTEMAALADDELRAEILADLLARFGELDRGPLSQIGWSAPYRDAREGWVEAVRPLIVTILETQDSSTERQRWQRRLDRFDAYAVRA